MLTDEEMEALTAELLAIYNAMEQQLVIDVAERFKTYRDVGGTLKWHTAKLDEVGLLNGQLVQTISEYSKKSKKEIVAMLKKAGFANLDEDTINAAYAAGLVNLTADQIKKLPEVQKIYQAAYKEIVDGTVKLIETKAVEASKKAYMQILNQAYLETTSGIYSYDEAITRGIQKMAEAGFYGATYVNPATGKTRHMSIEAVVRRDAISACNREANDVCVAVANDSGMNYVEVSSHLGARTGDGKHDHTNHAWWQGYVYAIEGEGTDVADNALGYHIRNLAETTGYGEVDGLGGVNCRHRMFPFIPGISRPMATRYDPVQNAKVYEMNQKLRKMERDERKWKRVVQAMKQLPENDEQRKRLQNAKKHVSDIQDQIIAFTKENGIRRQAQREMIPGE